jgi:NADH:ubiquinone oxidoreductase subunit E
MQDVQKEYRYLPEDALLYIAEKTGISRGEDLRRCDIL